MRHLSKSAVRVAREALTIGQAALPAYGSRTSRKDYTQPQLFALLVLRQFLRTDYRGVVTLVSEWSELRQTLDALKQRRAALRTNSSPSPNFRRTRQLSGVIAARRS